MKYIMDLCNIKIITNQFSWGSEGPLLASLREDRRTCSCLLVGHTRPPVRMLSQSSCLFGGHVHLENERNVELL